MKLLFIPIVTLMFAGCDMPTSQTKKTVNTINEKSKGLDLKIKEIELEKRLEEIKEAQKKEIQLKEISAKTELEIAKLNSQTQLAQIQKDKEIAKVRINAELEKQKIVLAQTKDKTEFKQGIEKIDQKYDMELKRYLVFLLGLFTLISSFFIYYFFKRRREDKLLAYNDNLKKYFHQKEIDARMKIADKMLDTLALGNLNKTQENLLIGAFNGTDSHDEKNQQQLTYSKQNEKDESVDVEIIEVDVK